MAELDNVAMKDLYFEILKYSVEIVVEYPKGERKIIGGVIIKSPGWVVTTAERVEGGYSALRVIQRSPNNEDRTFTAELFHRNLALNLALLKILEVGTSLPGAKFPDPQDQDPIKEIGMRVMTIAHLQSEGGFNLLTGYISYPYQLVQELRKKFIYPDAEEEDETESSSDDETESCSDNEDDENECVIQSLEVPTNMADWVRVIELVDLHCSGATGNPVYTVGGRLLGIIVFALNKVDYVVPWTIIKKFLTEVPMDAGQVAESA